jgi:replicative DNA helicase
VIGADAADGVGGDASVIIVLDITDPKNIEEVAKTRSSTVGISSGFKDLDNFIDHMVYKSMFSS